MNSAFSDYLCEQRIKNLSENSTTAVIAQLAITLITAAVLWPMVAHFSLILWFFLSLSLIICMVFLSRELTPGKPYYTLRRWEIANTSYTFIVGFVWSLAPSLLFVPDNNMFIILMILLFAINVSGALLSHFTYKRSCISFSIGTTTPFVLRLLYEGDTLHNTIAVILVFYVTMLTQLSFKFHALFVRSAEAEYRNELLINELEKEKDTVERSVVAKDQFLAAASHDLRQPLNAISLFTDALKPLQTTTLGSEILIKVRRSLTGLNSMLHGLLDISRLDAQVVDNNPKHTSLKTVVDQLFEEYKHNVKKIKITTSVTSDTIVFADPTILYRVLSNILDNSVKYSEQGAINILTSQNTDNQIDLIVKDSGVGIPKDKLNLVFDEFQQLNNPERDREKGLGLGLAIVKRLCVIANIEIKIDSQVGMGTQVTLTLRQGKKLNNIETNGSVTIETLTSKYILVIDDEKHIREGMQYLLTSYGCEVITADSLVVALEKLKHRTTVPDLIISDLRLRDELTGADAIDAIRDEYNKEIPAIIITGDTAPDKIIQAKLANHTTIYKPVEPDELRQAMGLALNTQSQLK